MLSITTKQLSVESCQYTNANAVNLLVTPLVINSSIDGEWRNNHLSRDFFYKNCLKIYFFYISCFISDSAKIIRLLALDFYEIIINSGFALINYHLIEILSS